jgi:hypothetical protein
MSPSRKEREREAARERLRNKLAHPDPTPTTIRALLIEPEPAAPPKSAPPKLAPPIGTSEPLPTGPAPKTEPPPEREGRWTPFAHTFWDELAPTLDPLEVSILGHLLRLTVGYKNRATCTIGLPRLAERCNVGLNTLRRAVARLEARGLVRRTDINNTGHNRERGTVWEVLLAPPKLGPAKTAGAKVAGARTAPMISEKKEENMPPSVYDIRTVAARLLEAHRTDSGFDRARLRALVRDALIGQGVALDEALVEEATRGMA